MVMKSAQYVAEIRANGAHHENILEEVSRYKAKRVQGDVATRNVLLRITVIELLN